MSIRITCVVQKKRLINKHACTPPSSRDSKPAYALFHLHCSDSSQVSSPPSTLLTGWSFKNATLIVQTICLFFQRFFRTLRIKSKLFWKPFALWFLPTAFHLISCHSLMDTLHSSLIKVWYFLFLEHPSFLCLAVLSGYHPSSLPA